VSNGSRGLDGAELANPGGYGGIPKDGHSFDPRRDLLEHLEPFPATIPIWKENGWSC
jgi:hypothetical protein